MARFGPLTLLLGLGLTLPIGCGAKSDATTGDADAGLTSLCMAPDTQVLSIIHAGATLKLKSDSGGAIRYGVSTDITLTEPQEWVAGDELLLPSPEQATSLRIFAEAGDCAQRFDHVYRIQREYEPKAGDPLSSAIGIAEQTWAGWATGFQKPVAYGSDVDAEWRHPEQALGPAEGNTTDTVSLGNGGQIVLTFDPPIRNGAGADFAVFENGFSDDFLELGFVEVSSDGKHFVRFDSAYLGKTPLPAYGTQKTELIGNLAGKYRVGFGTPFDLDLLRYRSLVQKHQVDLDHIKYVRIVDIIGDGSAHDSFGNPIYDPTPTVGSGGFDLDGIGVINAAQ